YGDAAWTYEIFTNAAGVQGDLRWTSGGDEDTKFDMVFTSRGKITGDGYHVEMAIPFSSLRFPERPVQNWKATFWRIRPRGSREESSWAGLDRENPCEFCQYGSITGIENVKPGGLLDLLPSLVGHQSAALSVADDPRSPFTQSGITASASLGARYAITPGIGVEATVNPDFSQVEADAAQINVNSTFAVTYPERRPFFQEGSDLFNTWFSIVNTRSINDPLAAAKLTGRTGGTSFAAISAYDRNTPVLLPFEEENIFIRGGKSLSNIIRARQALPENSFAGLMVTDRRFESGGSGTTLGIDGALRFLDNYTVLWQAVASRTAEGGSKSDSSQPALEGITFDHGRHTAALDGETFWGRGIYAGLKRGGKYWNFTMNYWDVDAGLRSANGFLDRNSSRQISAYNGVSLFPEIAWVDKIVPSLSAGRLWNADWLRKRDWISGATEFYVHPQTWLQLAYTFERERFRDVEFGAINHIDINLNSNFSDPMSLAFDISYGQFIARTLATPLLGTGLNMDISSTIKPFRRFNIQPTFSYSVLHAPEVGEIFRGYLLRSRFNYQFTRELLLRLVVQYDQFSRALNVDPLLTYKISPFTIFYIGSSHDYQEYDSSSHLTATGQQFFAKIQYLVQM
ncbi:MAG: DUF5916 domain-containing protein, partial [Candidatus Kapaibacterium sp.]